MVEPVTDKSTFSSISDKLKLLSTYKVVWTKLAQDLGVSSSVVVTYTYNYLFNSSLVVMAKEVIDERNQEVSIDVDEPDSDSILLRHMKRRRKLAVSDLQGSSTQHVNLIEIWREGITIGTVLLWMSVPTVHPWVSEDFLSQSISLVSIIIYAKFTTKLYLITHEYYQKIIMTLQCEHHYYYSQALQVVYWRLFPVQVLHIQVVF